MEFTWKDLQYGDMVKVIATKEELEEICAEEFEGDLGMVKDGKGDIVTVLFVTGEVRFHTYMLQKNVYPNSIEGDIEKYEDWLETSEADLLAEAYNEAYELD